MPLLRGGHRQQPADQRLGDRPRETGRLFHHRAGIAGARHDQQRQSAFPLSEGCHIGKQGFRVDRPKGGAHEKRRRPHATEPVEDVPHERSRQFCEELQGIAGDSGVHLLRVGTLRRIENKRTVPKKVDFKTKFQ